MMIVVMPIHGIYSLPRERQPVKSSGRMNGKKLVELTSALTCFGLKLE